MENMQNIMKTLEKHFSNDWLDIDYNQVMPERIAYMLIRDVNINECSDLTKNYKKGDIVYSFPSFDWNIISLSAIKHLSYFYPLDFFALPEDALLQLSFIN